MSVCSLCGGDRVTSTQRRKPRAIRRCSSCILKSNSCPSICSTAYSSHEEDPQSICDDYPEGISVDVIGNNGATIQQTQTNFGRSIHSEHDSNYSIVIDNERRQKSHKGKEERERIAVIVKVDGRKVSPSPILIGKQREIHGFTLTRTTVERHARGEDKNDYEIRKKTALFRTVSSGDEWSKRRGKIDSKSGTIELEFFRLKMSTIQPGVRTRKQRAVQQSSSPGRAREGLVSTRFGETVTETDGFHRGKGNKKPVADHSKSLGKIKLFLCDRRVATFGDHLR
ncbi:expressed unknown protein [Seminavis robusta]|uniref:Uncharacterized protein n=1 Tax=Seminavis robusta TaxID=568900 RepID=A0A9N8D6B3_9STRA|nr:expressed unknown protein [Seminavis robusta]|eukprot:Sro16_g011500.1 n/a (283) ;mRNA; r:11819-12667